MSNVSIFEWTETEATHMVNTGVDIFLSTLNKKKVITDEQLAEFSKYKMTFTKPTFFGKAFAKMKGLDEKSAYMFVVKVED
jgi:hypothetical protein